MLRCPDGHAIPVRDGIPRFVDSGSYAEAFGAQWLRYRTTQLDSHSGLPISRDRLRQTLGDDLWAGLARCQVLECGAGAGRFTEVLVDEGARVTSIDLSSAVDANAANVPIGEQHRVAQADILALPFAERQFDVVLCIGVIQHTPSPESTIAALYEHVRPGGWLVIDHYAPAWQWYTRTAPIARAMLRRVSPERGLRATERLVDVFRPLHLRARSRVAEVLVNRISPITCYDRAIPELPSELQREWALLDTHDSLTDFYKHRRSVSQLRDALDNLGLDDIWCQAGGNGVEARGRRPSGPR